MKHCNTHNLDYDGYISSGKFRTPRPCPMCEEELIRQEKEKANEEERRMRLLGYTKMNIRREFYDVTLENYITETSEQKKTVRAIKRLIDGEIQKLVILGKNGTGKTHLAIAAIKKLGGAIYSMSDILIRIRATYSAFASENESQIMAELANLPLLVIDELGKTKGSDPEIKTLFQIIDQRHSNLLPLIIISNKHLFSQCPSNGCPDCFENYVGEDSRSRLSQNGELLHLSGNDWRKTHPMRIPSIG